MPIDSSQSAIWKEVEDGWLRYDCASGDTVLISDFAHLVLEIFESQGTRAYEELYVVLRAEYPDLPSEAVASALQLALDSLTDIGLIRVQ